MSKDAQFATVVYTTILFMLMHTIKLHMTSNNNNNRRRFIVQHVTVCESENKQPKEGECFSMIHGLIKFLLLRAI